MPAGARTYRLTEALIEPKVLPPPPTRHALLAFLIALAAILHIGTVGWSDIQNGAPGFYSSAAREILRTDNWTVSAPPLSYWLSAVACKFIGFTAAAVRMPVAVAMVASVALTFLIGERLGGYWRGFIAGLIHLCSLGTFIWARMVTPEPLFAAFLGATVYCVICGYQRQQKRRFWFAGVWCCAGLACLTRGIVGLFLPVAIFLLFAIFFREARLRFRHLFYWPNLLLFLALVIPPYAWLGFHAFLPFDGGRNFDEGVPLLRFLVAHFLWWFPAAILVLPGVCFGWRKVFRPHEFEFADALPLCWMAVGFLPLLFFRQRQHFDSLNMWSAFALFAAAAWERTPSRLRFAGLVLVALAGAVVVGAAAFATAALPPLPPSRLGVRLVLLLAGLSLVFFVAIAGHYSWRNRETLAITVLMLGMVPIGLGIVEGLGRFGPYLSLADAARFLEADLGEDGEVLFEGSAFRGSSLGFYLDRPPSFVAPEDADATIARLSVAHPVYLIVARERVPYWQERLTEHFHIFHQETTCGAYVILNNQP